MEALFTWMQISNKNLPKESKFLLEQWMVAGDHQKWLLKILGFDSVISYKLGRDNWATDALSRKENSVILLRILVGSA